MKTNLFLSAAALAGALLAANDSSAANCEQVNNPPLSISSEGVVSVDAAFNDIEIDATSIWLSGLKMD